MNAHYLPTEIALLFRFFLVHILVCFVFLPQKWVLSKKEKRGRSPYLYLQGLVLLLGSYVLAGNWTSFWMPLLIGNSFVVIDYLRLRFDADETFKGILYAQLTHGIVLFLGWNALVAQPLDLLEAITYLLNSKKFLVITTAYIVGTTPLSYLIGIATKKWQEELRAGENPPISLLNAGKWIGIMERTLIITFVLLHEYSPIGLLIAAKSILRFKDTEVKQTEYVLIGTLMSYGLALLIGILTSRIAFG